MVLVPRSACSLIQARSDSSHGRRSSSVRGTPRLILAILASGWKSSASATGHPRALWRLVAAVVFPHPATPMSTRCSTGCFMIRSS